MSEHYISSFHNIIRIIFSENYIINGNTTWDVWTANITDLRVSWIVAAWFYKKVQASDYFI